MAINRSIFERVLTTRLDGNLRWLAIAPSTARNLILIFLVVTLCLFAFFFPITPDEVSRIRHAREWLHGDGYRFFWPAGNVVLILINPFVGQDMPTAVTAVRLLDLGLTLIPLAILIRRTDSLLALAVLGATTPYMALVAATAAQQGLMIGLFAAYVMAMQFKRYSLALLLCAVLYFVNPTMILVLPLGLLLGSWMRELRPWLLLCLGGYILLIPYILYAHAELGEWLPTTTLNGSFNLFRGNNPSDLAPRGVWDMQALIDLYGPVAPGDFSGAVKLYLFSAPWDFAMNLGEKALLYWTPWDHMRSGLGRSVETIVFCYVALSQFLIYTLFFVQRRRIPREALVFAVAVCISAWLVYTLFFVKIRFRIPFDFLLLFTVMAYSRLESKLVDMEVWRSRSAV